MTDSAMPGSVARDLVELQCIERETGADPDASVIWLHGLGASGHDFEPVVPELQLPDELRVRFVFPHAPAIPVTINGGFVMPAWYDILALDVERKVDTEQLMTSASRVVELIDREIARGIDSRRIVLAGFSQGGAVAYQVALTCPKPLAGLLALSTYFMTANTIEPCDANRHIPIQVMHGTHDPMVQEQMGQKAVQTLQAMGYQPQYTTYPMEHQVCLEQIRDISRWLQQVLGNA